MKQQNLPVLYQSPALSQTMKNIIIADAATGNHTQITIHPGTTAGDVLQQAGFSQDFALTRNREGESIPPDENLYESVPNGAKVWASTPVDFGTGRSPIIPFFSNPPQQDEDGFPFRQSKYSIRPFNLSSDTDDEPLLPPRRPTIRVTRYIEVKPAQLPYWQEKGWMRHGGGITTKYEGCFRSPRHKVRGTIEENLFGCKISVLNPPEHVLRHHRTWGCFHPRGNGWWEIHHHGCPNASSAIVQVERTLNEAETLSHENLY